MDILQRIIINDLSRFLIIYSGFVIGFSQSFYLVFQSFADQDNHDSHDKLNTEDVFNTPVQSIMDVFIITLGDVMVIYQELLKAPYSEIGKVILSIKKLNFKENC